MPESLTPIERKVYHYLLDFLTENTYQPSVREIGREFRIKSTKTVSEILQSLARKGFIERDPSRSRGVRLLGYQGAGRTMPVPPYTADTPAPSTTRTTYLTLDRRFVPNERVFYVRVDNVASAAPGGGILDGDYVLVDPVASTSPGDLYAERDGGTVTLRQAESAPRHANGGGTVLGKVCGVFRPFCEMDDTPAVVADS
jgi:repressor LexA